MRYTTLIDISEIPLVYRNQNARLIYLHLALKAGYHDEDRDLADVSIRRLAMDAGLTIAATRHAIKILETSHLVQRQGPTLKVTKWLAEGSITPREKSSRAAQQKEIRQQAQAMQRETEEREAAERRARRQMRAQGKTPFMLYYEDLERKAAAGDAEAAALARKHKATYEQQREAVQKESKTG